MLSKRYMYTFIDTIHRGTHACGLNSRQGHLVIIYNNEGGITLITLHDTDIKRQNNPPTRSEAQFAQ